MTKILKNTTSKTTLLYYENVGIEGLEFRYPFSKLIKSAKRKNIYNRAHEWCAGHGAIGFQLLEDRLCRSLVLSDIYEPAVQGCRFTAGLNNLQDCVSCYQINELSDITPMEKWDLFVGNPPWRNEMLPEHQHLNLTWLRKLYDFDWKIHNDLFQNLGRYTTDDVDVFLFEDRTYSSPDTWKQEIAEGGFKLCNVYDKFGNSTSGYVMHLIKG